MNALLNDVDLACPISCDRPVSHICGSLQQGASSFHYFLTLNFSHSEQAHSVSLTDRRMRKGKHEKPLKSSVRPPEKGSTSHPPLNPHVKDGVLYPLEGYIKDPLLNYVQSPLTLIEN